MRQLKNSELLCFACSKDALVRDLVIREFHVRPCREVFEIAAELVHDKRSRTRETGYLILGQLGSPERPFREQSIPLIIQGLKSEKSILPQCAIAYAIGHLVPPRALNEEIVDGLFRYLAGNRKSLQMAVAFAIAGLSITDRLDELVKGLLSSGSQDVREWVELTG